MKLKTDLFEKVLKWEGGFVNDPKDKGGMTIFGISRKYNPNLKLWISVDEALKVGSVTPSIAKKIFETYKQEIMKVYQSYADFIPEACAEDNKYFLFDFAVNAGVSNAKKLIFFDKDGIKSSVIAYYKKQATRYPYWKRNWTLRLRRVYGDSTIVL